MFTVTDDSGLKINVFEGREFRWKTLCVSCGGEIEISSSLSFGNGLLRCENCITTHSTAEFEQEGNTGAEIMKVEIGQVWKNEETNRIFVVRSEKKRKQIAESSNYSKIADYPHENDDLSYMCGNDWCRCMQ